MNYISEVKGIKEDKEGTHLHIFIPKKYLMYDIERFKQDGTKALAEIRLDDNRRIRNDQRKKYFATLKDIADYTGNILDDMHDYFKFIYCYRNRVESISMSNCSVTEAREMINIIMDFALDNDVPLSDLGLNRTDDIDRYLYKCLMLRKCVIEGTKAEIHHCTGSRVGMGGNRRKISNKGRKLIALSRKWHAEVHAKGEEEIFNKYKIYGIAIDDIGLKKLKLSEKDIS